MSLNAALNATIALIEGRTDIAKDILRSPSSDVRNVPEVIARLNRAVDRAAAKAIRNALMQTLAVQWKAGHGEAEVAFYTGMKAVEDVLEAAVERLEAS